MTNSLLSQDWRVKLANYDVLYVGFSGGLDSAVLLHVLANDPTLFQKLHAIHIHHGLSKYATDWETHCQHYCETLGIPITVRRVTINSGANIEEAARLARYQAFSELVNLQDGLLLAHHQDDQAETLLLQLLRGAGIDGLSAMPTRKILAKGELLRPFLQQPRKHLEDYAKQHQLTWVEDESNQNAMFSRNFLRHRIMPLLREKWPEATASLARSAEHCQQARCNLDAFANLDCESIVTQKNSLELSALQHLDYPRLVNVLRVWLQANDIRAPSAKILNQLINDVILARKDATPVVQWGDVTLRRYQQTLYILKNKMVSSHVTLEAVDNLSSKHLRPTTCSRDPKILPDEQHLRILLDRTGSLEQVAGRRDLNSQNALEWLNFPNPFQLKQDQGILSASPASEGLKILPGSEITVRFRQGGELFSWHGQTKQLKKLWQQWQVPPWQRDTIPLLYIDNKLAAVIGYAINDLFFGRELNNIYRVEWHFE